MTIAFWCVLAGIVLPYCCFGVARNRGRGADGKRLRSNRNPREFPFQISGVAKRAWDAHLNAFEALPAFAAAVLIAFLAKAPQARVDTLALAWVAMRVGHAAFYIADRPTLRSTCQFISLACVVGLFIVAGLAT
jgi:uncharacterized MAPEG superfamily protein